MRPINTCMSTDEMVDIMTHLHQYVPTLSSSHDCIITGETVKEERAAIHSIIIGGDQFTVARTRGAIKAKVNSQTLSKRLSGIIPVVEDWYAKANFLGVSACLYSPNCITATG